MLYLPILTLVLFSFNAGQSVAVWEGLSWRWYRVGLGQPDSSGCVVRSLQIASVAAILATIAATMAALATTRNKPFRGEAAVYAVINTPLIVPEIVTAIALLIFFASIKVSPAIPASAT